MLKITLPPNEKEDKTPFVSKLFPFPTVVQQQQQVEAANSFPKWSALAVKRQAIIQKLVDACPFKPGDEVKCYSLATQQLHGKDIVINKIVTSYAQIKNDSWPKNDEPMIIHAYSRDKDMSFICTAGYLIFKDAKEAE